MQLYPAIDLKDGQCVRLAQGDMARAKTYNTNPAQQAMEFQAQGFDYLHVVDLNGALAGKSINHAAVKDILSHVDIPIQLGGGIRDMAGIEHWLASGVRRVILGTAALQAPALVAEAGKTWPGRICVSLDARNGRLMAAGWTDDSALLVTEFLPRLVDCGVAAVIYTDIARDGMLTGVNLADTAALVQTSPIPVIASGGVGTMADIEALLALSPPVAGVICGRALYEGTLDGPEALAMVRARAC